MWRVFCLSSSPHRDFGHDNPDFAIFSTVTSCVGFEFQLRLFEAIDNNNYNKQLAFACCSFLLLHRADKPQPGQHSCPRFQVWSIMMLPSSVFSTLYQPYFIIIPPIVINPYKPTQPWVLSLHLKRMLFYCSQVAEVSPTGFDRLGTGIKIHLATEEHHGIWSAVVKGIIHVIHVTGAGRMRSHVTKNDVREESCPQAEGRGTGKTEGAVSVCITASVLAVCSSITV